MNRLVESFKRIRGDRVIGGVERRMTDVLLSSRNDVRELRAQVDQLHLVIGQLREEIDRQGARSFADLQPGTRERSMAGDRFR